MATDTHTAPVSKMMFWAGWIITALPVLGFTLSAVMKFSNSPEIAKGFDRLGYDSKLAVGLGICELTCTLLYAIPRTNILGAVLLTGYLGGAIATHLRIGDALVAPIILGVLVWLGPFLRNPRLRVLLPLVR
jgi:hypothetical protein